MYRIISPQRREMNFQVVAPLKTKQITQAERLIFLEELLKGKPEYIRSEVPQLKQNIQVTRNI